MNPISLAKLVKIIKGSPIPPTFEQLSEMLPEDDENEIKALIWLGLSTDVITLTPDRRLK